MVLSVTDLGSDKTALGLEIKEVRVCQVYPLPCSAHTGDCESCVELIPCSNNLQVSLGPSSGVCTSLW